MRKPRLGHAVGLVGLAVYGAFVLLVTMWPRTIDHGLDHVIVRLLAKLHAHGLPGWFGYDQLEFSANVGMFLPVGFFLALLFPLRAWWAAVLCGVAGSAAIEGIQSVLLPHRIASVGDVVANGLGALAGALVALAVRAVVARRDRRLVAYELWRRGLPARPLAPERP